MRNAAYRVPVARIAGLASILAAAFCLVAMPAMAQNDDQAAATAASAEAAKAEADKKADEAKKAAAKKESSDVREEVVVTGSRLKRDTFSSIAPLQVISGQTSREVGLIDAGTILQESTAASGVQIDLTFQGYVLDNGPGSSTVDLRGLGANRTLLLVDGRRLAPSGVEGAPSSPDINLVPAAMVERYEVLLDGASSVYGSDAIAGVVNIIMRKDFDGLELSAYSSIPAEKYSAGTQNTFSASWGHNGDRGFFGIGAEYRTLDRITLADRPWTDECDRHEEITTDGQVRTLDQYYTNIYGMNPGTGDQNCKIGGLTGYMTEQSGPVQLGSVFYTPGTSGAGIPNYSDYNAFSTVVDINHDGYADASFYEHNLNGNTQFADIIPDVTQTAVMAYGEYTFSGSANLTPYFEVQYNRRKVNANDGASQLFPLVQGDNPYNPCNPNAVGGVDCGEAYDSMLDNPNYAADFAAVQGLTPAQFRDMGIVDIYAGSVGPVAVQPVVSVRGDRNTVSTDLDQLRAVVGLKGDLPFLNVGSVTNWTFDVYASNTESDGDSHRPGIRGDRLDLALGNYSLTTTPCQNDGVPVASDTAAGCVPVNLFAPSLMGAIVGDFATQAERDYLFDSRDFDTKYRQTIYSGYITGDLFSLPGGVVKLGLGAEYREDDIRSIPDEVARDGLFFGFFSDLGAVGNKTTKEYFGEIELPILANVTGFKELTANFSTRHTKDEYYGGAWTWSGKLAWRPIDSLLLRATSGTSYRAPNLRENFLGGSTGFVNLTDPCVVPQAAYDPINGYDPTNDQRPAEVLANCTAAGIDPTTFTNGGNSVYSVEESKGGALDLFEEKSESWSAGLTWEQPFFTSFDFTFAATYYDIDIRDEIIDPSGAFIVHDCYYDLEGDSSFCSRITRDPDSTIGFVDQGFINRDSALARGVDVNFRFDWPMSIFKHPVDFSLDTALNRTLEYRTRLLNETGTPENESYQGEFGFPQWKGRTTLRADAGNWRYTWSVRYVGAVEEDPAGIDDYDNVFTGFADTCTGPENGDVNCRNIGYADKYFVHDASVYYYGDVWTIGAGLRNVFNKAPPLVDSTEVFAYNNVPLGAGYDFLGRTLFVNLEYHWQ